MRILHCLRAPVGGLFRHVLDLAAEQARRGHEVGILADSNSEDRLTAQKFAAVEPLLAFGILRTPMSRNPGLGDFQAYRTVYKHATPLNFDILHGHGAKGGAYARLAARALTRDGQNLKAFYTPHGGSLHFKPGTPQAALFLGLERVMENYSSGLIFESAYASRVYAERIHTPGVPFQIIPNGLQPDDFARAQPVDSAADILYVGELRNIKGIEFLIEALAALNKKRRTTAAIVGAGPSAESLKAKVRDLGLDDTVTFTGALPARQAFTLGRIMVVPSLSESFPYIVLEAAAAGLPIIATSVGGIPEITAGTDTTLIPPGDAGAIEQAISKALADPTEAAARATHLRDNVQQKFSVAGMADAVLAFYALSDR
ncbi:MAG TPA: glycosyltransferase family 4 protein [Hyphomicrobium sp.]|nr:glycosyltransferase family 4 protein [Hyphomicrobium sp.]